MTSDMPAASTPAQAAHSFSSIASALGLHDATDEQRLVIEAPPVAPALVVAGAGSGKTETMANRVLWLVANGHVQPDEVLGLTFTKKAAGELQQRISRRIGQLAAAGLISGDDLELRQPTVSTYNSFANTIFRDNALIVGRDPESELLGETGAWVLARDIALASDDERLAGLASTAAVADALRRLANALGDNAVAPRALTGFADEFATILRLPDAPDGVKLGNARPRKPAEEAVAAVRMLDPLIALAERYDDEKRRRGLVEYSDQVRFALAALERDPGVAVTLRDRHRVVLLDEYQDTSVVQVRLLSRLFREHPVMAVGDPNQSIYGWRGASAGTLASFHDDFGGTETFALSRSWRNGPQVLAVANRIVEQLPAGGVQTLQPRPGASDDAVPVLVTHFETLADEAAGVAEWMRAGRDELGATASGAVLFRSRSRMQRYADAMRDAGVPTHIIGTGGLLAEPEATDLVSMLRVLASPLAGSDLVRILSGSRWRIGVHDLDALQRHARALDRLDAGGGQLGDDVLEAMRSSTESDASASIVDALDHLQTLPDGDEAWRAFGETGARRLRAAGREIAWLRRRAGMPIVDFVRLVERRIGLDVEVAANPHRVRGRAVLDAFAAEVHGFAAADSLGTLSSLVSWLEHAARGDDLASPAPTPEPGVVQLLTIHGSKGLEWDLVAVPMLNDKTLPSSPKDAKGWLSPGVLPHRLRGDRDHLPDLDIVGIGSLKEYVAAQKAFVEAMKARQLEEERRLAYVAVTRAKRRLLLSGAFWIDANATIAKPSEYLLEAAEVTGVTLPDEPESPENPAELSERELVWPVDPLGRRRADVEWAAAAVLDADASVETPWSETIRMLLEERDARRTTRASVPDRIPASRFKDWLADPEGVARDVARPMPQRPFRATRLGTLFHEWVEARAQRQPTWLGDVVDDAGASSGADGADDLIGIDAERFERLRQTFAASPYAPLAPLETELEIHLPLAGHTVVCKIDAVYERGDRIVVVDWKTGAMPDSDADLESRQLQLALYREAYAQHAGIDASGIDAEFYFVEHDSIVAPTRIMGRDELERRLGAAMRTAAGSAPEST